MLRIGDFSKLTHISVRMLRYYDSQNLLKPANIDPVTGYRMYAANQVAELQKIVLLRDLGFGVSEIAEALENWDDALLTRRLRDKIDEAEAVIAEERQRIANIQEAIAHIGNKEIERHYNVTIKAIPPIKVISLRRKMPDYFDEGSLWRELSNFIRREHIEYKCGRRNNVTVFHDSEHMDTNIDTEVCYAVRKLGKSKDGFVFRELEPLEHAACMMVYGPYDRLAGAYRSFVGWLSRNPEYSLGGTSRQVTLIDQRETNNPEEYLTEIQLPLIAN